MKYTETTPRMTRFGRFSEAFDFILRQADGPVSVLVDERQAGRFVPRTGEYDDRRGVYAANWGGTRDQRYIVGRLNDGGMVRTGCLPPEEESPCGRFAR